jgi:hypothetical protein
MWSDRESLSPLLNVADTPIIDLVVMVRPLLMNGAYMQDQDSDVSILKCLWRRENGQWVIGDIKGLRLQAPDKSDQSFFPIDSQLELLSSHPAGIGIESYVGTTENILQQSVLPVVAWLEGEMQARCIGTAFVVSCTGYVLTAAHVALDPIERDYGPISKEGRRVTIGDRLNMGVLIPHNSLLRRPGATFYGFERCAYWGEWIVNPLFHKQDEFKYLTDVAICKIPEKPDGTAHQPLNLSLNAFKVMEKAFAIGYAEMDNIQFEVRKGELLIQNPKLRIYVSVGRVMNTFPQNHLRKDVPAPGPCFDFHALIPGKMSGAPIFGADGAIVRGLVSRSFSGEKHAYGAMLGPAMHLNIGDGLTLRSVMEAGRDGIAKVHGAGL